MKTVADKLAKLIKTMREVIDGALSTAYNNEDTPQAFTDLSVAAEDEWLPQLLAIEQELRGEK